MLGLGASRVTIVEGEPPVLGNKQAEVIRALMDRGYPCDTTILTAEHHLNPDKCDYVQSHMEDYVGAEDCFLTYSVCVGEHVEDLTGFFTSCKRVLEPGGLMVHYIDLGGHGMFEDPMPPLDFHLYSDFLYGTIYPRYHRATRRFTSDYIRAAHEAGFKHIQASPTRKADLEYIKARRPHFRSRAKTIPDDELAVLEFVLSARAC
jgi:SAM-dependent methyltransferase